MLAERYHKRPSEFFKIDDDWLAYQFDVAVTVIGLTEQGAPAGTQRGGGRPSRGAFRKLKPGARKVRLNADGTW